jgi:hypothetical protein
MSRTTPPVPAALVALLALALPGAAAAAAPSTGALPHALPPAGATAARAAAAAPPRWIVAARATPAAQRIARRHGARALRLRGVYAVPTGRARALAGALRAAGLLRFSEADAPVTRASTFEGQGSDQTWTRGTVIAAGLTPPAAFAPIGIIDDVVDAAVADVSQVKVLPSSPGRTLDPNGDPETAHGTAVASVAAGRADGQGVIGIAPGAPLLSYGLKTFSCGEAVDGILALADAGAKVINISASEPDDCHAMQLAIGAADGEGALVVAAAGNDGERGDPIAYPAAYPHVLTVGALDLGLAPASFSTAGDGVDVAAPGQTVPAAVPPGLDRDGTPDGLNVPTGTSFAAPIVSGLASWLIAARPALGPGQVADVLRSTAKDVSTPGWDSRSGFGLPSLAAALAAPAPAADRGEPDDGIDFVDGSAFTKPDPYVSGTVRATVAPVEDPADVRRVRVKARGRLTATLKPTGDADLYVYSGGAKSLAATPVKRSRKPGTATDTVTVRNATRRARTYYVAVRVPSGAARAATDLAYTLKLSRR